jgi:KaiC/GvpD/RAD55 family RecA-like ATPase
MSGRDALLAALDHEAADARAPRIVLRPIAEIVAERRTVKWLLPRILEAGVLALLAGRRGSFKSFVAIDWAMRCASAGHPVVILSGEGAGLDRRVDAWVRAHSADIELDPLPIHALERAVNLNNRDILTELASAIDAATIRPELVIVDTMSKYSPGLDENSNAETAQFLAGLSVELRERYDCTVLLVAHTGHGDQKRARGASALGANTDAEYLVDRPEGSNTATVSRSRFKDSPELPPLAYIAEVFDLGRIDDDGTPVTSMVLQAADAPAPQSAPRIIGKNMVAAATAMREWARTRPEARHIATPELTELLEAHGINRKRRLEVINGLVNLRALTAALGGYTLDASVLDL